jgi:hypothetical protein
MLKMRKRNITSLLILIMLAARLQAADLVFDIRNYPFSYAGSYMAFMLKTEEKTSKEGLFLNDVSGERMWGWKGVFKVELLKDGVIIPFESEGTQAKLLLKSPSGMVEICFESADIVRFRSKDGLSLKLTQMIESWSGANFPLNYEKSVWMCKMWGPHYSICGMKGKIRGDAAKSFVNEHIKDRPQFILDAEPDENGVIELAVEQFQDAYDGKKYEKPFDNCVEDATRSLDEFKKKIPATPSEYDGLRDLGAYLKWSSVVNPRSCIKRTTMYQSKNYMTAIWSWDNCFGAMAVCNDHSFALDQLLVMFDYQTKLGILPDFLTEKYPMYAAYKPPVYGFTMQKMNEISSAEFSKIEIASVYNQIAKLTNFWLNFMDNNNNGIPQYNNSNDCADNCAIFQVGYPTETPDLSTHLIIQMDYLAKAANQLGKKGEAKEWTAKADKLTRLLCDSLWIDGRFVSKNSFTGEYCKDCQSFVNYTPILLGNRLPKEIKEKLLSDLKNSGIVTPFGPASEHPKSPWFIEDGYWRGAIWSPQYLFLVEGLKKSGETEWAKQLAKNYCEMCLKHGFPENFSALDGHPMRDMGYSWTVDVFFVLAKEYLK